VFVSCANSTDNVADVTTAGSTETTAETTAEDTEIRSSLPANLDFGGEEINVWYFTKNSDTSESFLNIKGELTGDIIDNVLYERNVAIEEQLKVKMNYIDVGTGSSDVGNVIRPILMADDTSYDLFNVVQWNSGSLSLENLFYNLNGAPYIDLEKPWWATDYMREMAIGTDKLYFLCGDVSPDMIRCIASMYFNKNLYTNALGSPDDVYDTVLNGQWTMDKLMADAAVVYADIDGDGTVNPGDRLGYTTNKYNNIDPLVYGAGVRTTERDANDVPYLVLNNERTASFAEKLYKLCFETVGGRADARDNLLNIQDFSNGNVLYLLGFLYTSEKLRDMEDDYGIIPFPKYNEEQDNYYAVVHDIATLMCLPTNCTKVEQVAAVLEAMAYYSYKNVMPAYYETALKTKYVRDQSSAQIIDLIHNATMTDIAYVYSSSFNGLGYLFREFVTGGQNNFASLYTGKEKTALVNMDKLVNQYLELS
jgi:hypothetical protein